MTRVSIKDGVYLNKAINEIFEEFKIGKLENKNVLVKPNMLKIAKPEECVITDPRLIEGVVDYLIKRLANVIVGDNPIPQNVNEIEVARRCGFLEASRGRFKNIGIYTEKMKLIHNSVKEIYVSRDILDTEVLISLPKFKTHALTILSIAVKNQFGIIPGGLKPKLHYQCKTFNDFCNLLIELYNLRKPDLIIVDALNIIDARGRIYRLNKLIAGDNAWAVDYVCSLIAGINPELNPLLRIALKEKFFNPREIEIKGDLKSIKGFAVPISMPIKEFLAGIGSRIFARLQNFYCPVIELDKCSRCGSCENVCPVEAIKNFKINNRICIKCYCCFEVCPQNAINKRLNVL